MLTHEKAPGAATSRASEISALGGERGQDSGDAWTPPELPPELAAFDAAIDGAEPEPAKERPASVRLTAEVLRGEAFAADSHVANAHRLRRHFGDRLLFVEGIGWHTWGPPWVRDENGAVRIAQGLGRIIAAEAAERARTHGAKDDDATRLWKWAAQSEQAGNVNASLAMAQPWFAVRAETLDADPWLLGCPGGVLELRAGVFREHRQSDCITKTAGADPDLSARAPTWERFLREVTGGDNAQREYLQRLAGYALCGHRGEHVLPVLYGPGGNGKGVFVKALEDALGQYAKPADAALLMAKPGAEHPTIIADLMGRRFVPIQETAEGGRLAEERVKHLTGGDRLSARFMRQDFFSFEPTHLIVLATNYKPRVSGQDAGIWRRLRLVPFLTEISEDARDPHLGEKLRAELPGILGWCFEGFRRYQREGLKEPANVRSETAAYRDSQDTVGTFLADCCELEEGATTAPALLYEAFARWCRDAGEQHLPQTELIQRLEQRGFERGKSNGARRWRGIRLRVEDRPQGRQGRQGRGFDH